MSLFCRLAAIVLMAHLTLSSDTEHAARAADTNIEVVTVHSPPYVWVKKEDGATTYTGFVPDLLEYVLGNLGKNYTLTASDGYGAFNDGNWTGMIGDVVNKKADLAAAPLTKNAARANAVAFAEPFLTTKLQLLKSKKQDKLTAIKQLASNDTDVAFAAIQQGNTWQLLTAAARDNEELAAVINKLQSITSIGENIDKVRNNELVLIVEGQFANYWVSQHPCDLDTTDGETIGQSDRLEYAFAVHKTEGAALLAQLNSELGKNETQAKIDELQEKYWPKGECNASSDGARQLVGAGIVVTWLATLLLHVF